MYYLTKFGGLKFPLYNATVEWGQVVRGDTMLLLPGHGEFDIYGANPAPVAPALLTWSGVSRPRGQSPTQAKDLRIDLERWTGMIGHTAQLQRQGMGITSYDYCNARLEEIRYPTEGDIRKGHAPVSMLFQLLSPWLRGGLTIIPTGNTATITNTGNRVSKPILTVVVNDDCEFIQLYHDGIGAGRIAHLRFDMPETTAGNDTVVIDTKALRVTLNGGNAYQYFEFGSEHKRPEWFPLVPGGNPLRCFTYPVNSLVSWSVTYDIPVY